MQDFGGRAAEFSRADDAGDRDAAMTGAAAGGSAGHASQYTRRDRDASAHRELWRRYRVARDTEALDRLVRIYTPLAERIAARITAGLPPHVDRADVESYALLGLLEAIERFEPSRGTPFESFAALRIRGAVLDELRRLDALPRTARSRMRRIEEAIQELGNELHHTPTAAEIAGHLALHPDEVSNAMAYAERSTALALDDRLAPSGDDVLALLDTVPDERERDPAERIERQGMLERLATALSTLNPRERLILGLMYFESYRMRDVADVLGVTESRVSQLHSRAVRALRPAFEQAA